MPLAVHKSSRRLTFLDLATECKMEILWELCTQFGEVEEVYVPRGDRQAAQATEGLRCYVTFVAVEDAKFCYEALHRARVKLFGRELRILHDIPCSQESGLMEGAKRRRVVDLHEIGAKLFVKGINPEAKLYDITAFFEKFGPLAVPIRMLTDKDGNFKGKIVVSYCDFETSDRVLQEMNRAVLFDRLIAIEYAELEDGSGLRHGNDKERENAQLLKEERRRYAEQLSSQQQRHHDRAREQHMSSTAWAQPVAAPAGRR